MQVLEQDKMTFGKYIGVSTLEIPAGYLIDIQRKIDYIDLVPIEVFNKYIKDEESVYIAE